MNWFNSNAETKDEDYNILYYNICELKDEIERLNTKLLTNSPASTQELSNRVADLEVKISKLWTLLTTTTPNNQDKLSKYGKVFGGKSKGLI